MIQNKSQNLEEIPGVGETIAGDFCRIGIKRVSDLKGKNPEKLYKKICEKRNEKVDKCMLYVCREAVYFSETKKPNPEKLKWWNWKDE